ncbi:MAG: hypothetical protein EA384_08060 [Spirochaetaceae bacterium]|nr:MAG: hypothetical protein EA384_08060 [Spirochaetaceae bacterium]
MPHALLDSIEDLIDTRLLSSIAGCSVTSVFTRDLVADFAKSGSSLLVVETNEGRGPRFVLKRVNIEHDWLMRATDDTRCRSVTLWQSGLFDLLPERIEHGVLACAHDGNGYAILMRDVGASLLANRRFREEQNRLFLDVMAEMHACFLDDPQLDSTELGLCEMRHVYEMFSLRTGAREIAGIDEVPKRIVEGWEMVRRVVAPDVVAIVETLLQDCTPLCDALSRYPQTLVHGDFRHSNQGIISDRRVVLLDWQLATKAPPSVELGRYLGANSALLPGTKEETLALYRHRLQHFLGSRFDPRWWTPQLDLGLLGGFVQDGWAIALKATSWHVGAAARDHWEIDLRWWTERVRAAVDLL